MRISSGMISLCAAGAPLRALVVGFNLARSAQAFLQNGGGLIQKNLAFANHRSEERRERSSLLFDGPARLKLGDSASFLRWPSSRLLATVEEEQGVKATDKPEATRVGLEQEVNGALGAIICDEGGDGENNLSCEVPPFTTIMAANRAEIAVRIMRAATELNVGTVAIYATEDRYSQHRWGADRSFLLRQPPAPSGSTGTSPIQSYLDMKQIIEIAKDAKVDAIHPGYGFLSESHEFAQACEDAGIVFIGPTVDNLKRFSDKTAARQAAVDCGVPVVPGSDGALESKEQVVEFVEQIGLPVILKASMGGGGKGMRVVRAMEELVPSFESASREALASFGDGSVFVERFVDHPRHIEVQILGDGTGNVVHLWERDCSVQRRHQKVVEMAPAWSIPADLRSQLHQYAIRLTSAAKYRNAGTGTL
jgi:pyruvate carboxylase